MRNVAFVAHSADWRALRFVRAAAQQADIRFGLVSQEPLAEFPASVRTNVAAHCQVKEILDASELTAAVQALAEEIGSFDCLLGVLEFLQVPLAEARERLGIEGMSVEVARGFREKATMKARWRAAGIDCARWELAVRSEDVLGFAARVGFPLVLKPPDRAGSEGVCRVDREEELRQIVATRRPSKAQPVLVEEFIDGREGSFESFFIAGQPVWHFHTHYLPPALKAIRDPSVQWCVLLPRETDAASDNAIRETGLRALEALGLDTGIGRLEWLRRKDGSVVPSEAAARPPGAEILPLGAYAHGFDIHHAWARMMIHRQFDPPARRFAAGAAFLRGRGGRRVAGVRGLDGLRGELHSEVVDIRAPQRGQETSDSFLGEGFVVLRHAATAVVEDDLKRICSRVHVDMR